jgi:septum formation protein
VDEARHADEPPQTYVERVALAKASAGWQSLAAAVRRPVIGADTAILLDDDILGKPHNRAEGIAMLAKLSGRSHQVFSAVAVLGEQQAVRTSISEVSFRELRREECEAYWQTGEPRDKAGSYAIQGLAAIFISQLRGSYSGVMGLPLFETALLLRQFGVELLLNQNQASS